MNKIHLYILWGAMWISFAYLFLGCATYVFRVEDEVVFCKDVIFDLCGLSLYRCDNGIDYLCRTNISEVVNEDARKEIIRMHEEDKKNPKHEELKKEGWEI